MTQYGTFAEQLSPVAKRLFPRRPKIILVSQVTADVAGDDNMTEERHYV